MCYSTVWVCHHLSFLLLAIRICFHLRLLWIKQLYKFLYMFFDGHVISFLISIYLGVGLLGPKVCTFLTLVISHASFPQVVVLVYTPTSIMWGLIFSISSPTFVLVFVILTILLSSSRISSEWFSFPWWLMVWAPCHVLVSHVDILLRDVPFRVFRLFFYRIGYFLTHS